MNMKHLYTSALALGILLVGSTTALAQNVGIANTAITPDAEAILELRSTTKGVLLPRMTTFQANILATSLNATDDGMTIYDTDAKRYKYWDGGTLQWNTLATSASVTGNTLDDAYDAGGSGTGRTITADAGSVRILGTGGTVGLETDGDIHLTTDDSYIGVGSTTERIEFEATDNEIAIMGATGGVGINTEDPDAELDIIGQPGGDPFVMKAVKNSNAANELTGIGLGSEDLSHIVKSGIVHERESANGVGKLHFLVDNNTDANDVAFTEARMTIDRNGLVGIGTTTPGYRLTLGTGGGVFGVENTATFLARNSGGTYESYFWPRWSDNVMYMNYGSGGLNLRNNSSQTAMFIDNDRSINIAKGVLFDCNDCGSTSTIDGASNWGDLVVQGRVFSTNSNLHLSPPAGSNVIINDTYRAAGGSNAGTAGLQVESLAGAGNRVLMADASGVLYSTNTLVGTNVGDNLGNHSATTTLQLNGQAVAGSAGTVLDGGGGWHRTYGNTGWYNGTHGGGFYMTDATWVRAYNNKSIWTSQTSQADVQMNSAVFNFGQWDNGLPTFYDGQFYRTGGQAEMRFDDWFYMRDNSNTIRHQFNSDGGEILLGPNTGWSRYLRLGGNGNVTSEANIATTNGNLHMDSRAGHQMYLNFYNNDWVRTGNGGTGYQLTGSFEYFDNDDWIYNRYAPNDRVYYENRMGVGGNVSLHGNPWGWPDARCTGCGDAVNGSPNLWLTATDRVFFSARNGGEAYEFTMNNPGIGFQDKGVVPEAANWGRLGTPGRYWWTTYSGHFRYKHFWDDYESFDTYDDIAELRAIAMDTVWDPILNHHVGKIRGETLPKFIMNYEDKEGAGEFIDVRRMDGFLLGVSRQIDRETVERDERLTARTDVLASALGVDFSKPRNENITVPIRDMGSSSAEGDKIEVTFEESFASKITSTPIISITPTAPHQSFYVADKTNTGFTVMVARHGDTPFSFDWTAMGETEVSPTVGEKLITSTDDVFYRKPIVVTGKDHPVNNHEKRVDPTGVDRAERRTEGFRKQAEEVSRKTIEQMNSDANVPELGVPPHNPAPTGDAAEADPSKRSNPPSENDLGPGPPNGGPVNPNDKVGTAPPEGSGLKGSTKTQPIKE